MDIPQRDRLFELLPKRAQRAWQALEDWSYGNDGEKPSEAWGGGPAFLGLRLAEWIPLVERAPELGRLLELEGAVDRWEANKTR